MIRLAEHPKTEPNVMSVASTKLFERLRKEGVSLIDVIYKAENQNANFQPQSNLVMKNAHLNTEVFHQKTMIAKLEKKVFTLGKRLAVAQNDNAELREASKKAKAKFSERIESASKTNDAKIAALKAELKSARARAAADRADLAAERAKPAPISATVVVALAKMTRDQEAEITRLKGALAKANAAAAPIPINTPASAPAASAGLSKRSQGAFKASATPPANAAASPTAAPKAPRETLTTRVVDILKSCQGMSMDAQDLAERLATNRAYENKSFNWHKCLSDQLRTEVLGVESKGIATQIRRDCYLCPLWHEDDTPVCLDW